MVGVSDIFVCEDVCVCMLWLLSWLGILIEFLLGTFWSLFMIFVLIFDVSLLDGIVFFVRKFIIVGGFVGFEDPGV